MKITIESTSEITQISRNRTDEGIPARVWVGQTESGIAVQCLVTRIAVLKTEDTTQFDAELQEEAPPVTGERAFPLRMIL